jgi:spore coat polysaccharide biosynthesis protein SpsF (cytidylyltransferase family)
MKLNNGIIILARMDSKRFPYKAITKLGDKKLIEWCIDGVVNNKQYKTILATTNREIDKPLMNIAKNKGISYFQGALDNVANRVLECIKNFNLDYFARVNGDSPFVRKELLIEGFKIIYEQDLDVVTNLVPRAFPYGISVEILKSSIFCSNYDNFTTNCYKEHITSYFYEHFGQFKTYCMQYEHGNDSDVRLVVDTPSDREHIEKMLSYSKNIQELTIAEIVKLYRGVEKYD